MSGWQETKWMRDDSEIYIERTTHLDDTASYAVRRLGSCLSRSGKWVIEPMPSSRTDAWLKKHRFKSFDEAASMAMIQIEKESETA
jgi:hypothetical protein